MDKHLHIVAFDVPYPPIYGGIIDLYFQLKALHKIGVKITYHCFYYEGNNSPTNRLNDFAEQVFYYHRKKHIGKMVSSKLPFIVATRNDKKLLENLKANEAPILFSGLQSCFYLNHPDLLNREKFVRTHNIEHNYYRGLAAVEKNRIKKQYYLWEAKKLEKFESVLVRAKAIFSIAKMDINHFSQYAKTYHSPPFFRFKKRQNGFDSIPLFGLFQGNLSVNENIETVKFIAKNIAPFSKYEIIIAGKDPSQEVIQLCTSLDMLKLVANPSQDEMNMLIENAQINLLFTQQQTGIKLKLLHALAIGKHIIINSKMDDKHLFQNLCIVEDQTELILKNFKALMSLPFTQDMFDERQELFLSTFNNEQNAHQTMVTILG
ncbi:MAG: hypothetical protein AB8B72_03075 [Crocinitomicaceae bacterium]